MSLVRKGKIGFKAERHGVRRVLMAAAVAAIGAVGWSAPAAANVGIDVMVQNWDPSLPEPDALMSVMNHPGKIGDDMLALINGSKAQICSLVKQALGRSDAFAKGVTLYKIDCTLGTPGMVTARQTGPWSFELAVGIPGNRIKADATQPTVAGSWADPSVSVTFDLTVKLAVLVGNSPLISVQDAHVDVASVQAKPENFVTEIYALIMDAFGLRGRAMEAVRAGAEQGINANGALKQLVAGTLQQAQQLLPAQRAYTLKGFKLSGNKLRFAFVPQQFAIKPASGVVDGLVRFPADTKLVQGCNAFQITAHAQAKPREFRGFDVPFGPAQIVEAPARFFPQPVESSGGYQSCQYQIVGLPEGTYTRMTTAVPKLVAASSPHTTGAPLAFNVPMLAPQGFYDFVIPQPRAVASYELRMQRIPGTPIARREQLKLTPPVGPQGVLPVVPVVGPRPPTPTDRTPVAPFVNPPRPLQTPIAQSNTVRMNVAATQLRPRLMLK